MDNQTTSIEKCVVEWNDSLKRYELVYTLEDGRGSFASFLYENKLMDRIHMLDFLSKLSNIKERTSSWVKD